MINEKLEKLNQEIAKGEARLRRAQHEEKILEHQVKQLSPIKQHSGNQNGQNRFLKKVFPNLTSRHNLTSVS